MILIFKTFCALLYKEMVATKHQITESLINVIVWLSAIMVGLLVFMPSLGLSPQYALIMLPAAIISRGIFDILGNASAIIADINGSRSIEYELTLPVPQWMVFLKIIITHAYHAFMPSLCVFPLGLGIIYVIKGFSYPHASLFKMIFALVLANIFYGALGLLLASMIQQVGQVRNVWMRVIFPLWWLGGFNYSWSVMYKVSPSLAYVMLVNPLVWIMESARGSLFGQEGFLPYWYCIGIISCFIIVFTIIAIERLKKRLDCI